MRTLIEKEIRLLLPAFVGAIGLAAVPAWLVPSDIGSIGSSALPFLFWLGFAMLAVSSFGREFALRTMSFQLTQPVERGRIWRTKIAVLAVFVVLAFCVWFFLGSIRAISESSARRPRAASDGLELFGLLVPVFAVGGLSITLLLRQMAAGFWLSLLLPMSVVVAMGECGATDQMISVGLSVYTVAGFFLARWQFLHLQDGGWTGGVITFGVERVDTKHAAVRRHRPWRALIWKEIKLQQFTLAGMGCLLVLHLGAVAMRRAGAHAFGEMTRLALEAFGLLWFIVPAVAGAQTVAEERQMGTFEGLLCLPVSRKAQFAIKMISVLILGGVLSPTILCAVEGFAGGKDLEMIPILVCFLAVSLLGAYASTLTRGMVSALAATVLTLAIVWVTLFLPNGNQPITAFGFTLWQGTLLPLIGCPAMAGTLLWMSHRNFSDVSEGRRSWIRNARALAMTAVVAFGLTTAIYNRAWESLTPLEPPHGTARLSVAKPPVFRTYGGRGLALLVPDGTNARLWVDRLGDGPRWQFHIRDVGDVPIGARWTSLGGNEFAPGSNWVDSVANSRETVAIRSDGTLWVSEKPRTLWGGAGIPPVEEPAGLVQFGNDTNWQSLIRHADWAVLLLKRDGTLWDWGTNSFNSKKGQPSLREFEPRRIGTNSDWTRLIPVGGQVMGLAWKKDGTAWGVEWPERPTLENLEPMVAIERLRTFDTNRWIDVKPSPGDFGLIALRDDGTLWLWNRNLDRKLRARAPSSDGTPSPGFAPAQIGRESDWAGVAASFAELVARKRDGSLWKWDWPPPTDDSYSDALPAIRRPPVQLGTHSDWISVGQIGGQILSLAADGDLWIWPNQWQGSVGLEGWNLLLAPSRKPARIENIFSALKN